MKKQRELSSKKGKRRHLTPEEIERARRYVQESTLMDDVTMMMAVEGDLEAATAMLKPLLPDEDFTLKEVKVQYALPPSKADGRRVIFDALALDHNGNAFDIEVQKADRNFSAERMLYYACSLVHANSLKKKEDYASFRRVVVVFFCDGDFLNTKVPVSRIVPVLKVGDQVVRSYENLVLVVYANIRSAEAKGELAKLFEDMRQANPDKMYASALANALDRVKNKDMDENTLQWVIDHMSNEEYAKYKKNIAEAEKRGEAKGIRIGEDRGVKIGEAKGIRIGEKRGAGRTVAKLLSEGLISREKAASVLGVDEASLDRVLGKYRV